MEHVSILLLEKVSPKGGPSMPQLETERRTTEEAEEVLAVEYFADWFNGLETLPENPLTWEVTSELMQLPRERKQSLITACLQLCLCYELPGCLTQRLIELNDRRLIRMGFTPEH